MNQSGIPVQIRRTDFFNYVTWVYPDSGTRNFITVTLVRKEVIASFMASDGSSLDIDGAQVELPANAYVDATGTAYTDRVEVAARWLDPTDPALLSSLPGSSMGIGGDGKYQTLVQTGMLMLELFGTDGQELQLTENAMAKLRLPLAEQWQGCATSERSMWYMDEEEGVWIEDGAATWQGGYYEAVVSHFTFWCCSPPFTPVNLRGQLVTATGEPIVQRVVSMEVVNTGLLHGGVRTNGVGQFSGFAPLGEELRMVVWDACGEEAFSENIGSYTTTTDLGTFTLTDEYYFRFTGQALDCNFEPLANAFVTVRYNGYNRTYIADDSGNYTAGLYLCAENGSSVPFELRLADINTGLVSPWLEQELANEMNFSTQLACDTPAEDFIEVNCAGETRTFLTPETVLDYGLGSLVIWDSLNVVGQGGGGSEFNLRGQGDLFPEAGASLEIIEAEYSFFTIGGERYYMSCHESSNEACDNFHITITENEGPGGYVGGIFSGSLMNSTDNTETPLNGRFRIKQQ